MTPCPHDPWDEVAWCRDESCPREDLHASHEPMPLRGRTPKACPSCLKSLEGSHKECLQCGWKRVDVAPAIVEDATPTASPWVACPACSGEANGCLWCSKTGIMPRLRAMRVREALKRGSA